MKFTKEQLEAMNPLEFMKQFTEQYEREEGPLLEQFRWKDMQMDTDTELVTVLYRENDSNRWLYVSFHITPNRIELAE